MESKRVWEIDFFRAVAIVLMIVFHFIYDLNEFSGAAVDYSSPPWAYIGTVSGILFIFISGISSGFSSNPVKRGIKVLLCGMIITLATFIFLREEYIRFGILHFLGLSMILSVLIRKLKVWQLSALSVITYILGIAAKRTIVNTVFLIPFGFMYRDFVSADYYPLFPYITFYIIGIIVYKLFYYRKKSIFPFEIKAKFIDMLSRNSLTIYMVHQPAILLLLFAAKYLNI